MIACSPTEHSFGTAFLRETETSESVAAMLSLADAKEALPEWRQIGLLHSGRLTCS